MPEREIELSFEEALARLEEIVKELESGGLSLEKSLDRFSEGVKLIRFCSRELAGAEKKIELVLKENQEYTTVVPYTDENHS